MKILINNLQEKIEVDKNSKELINQVIIKAAQLEEATPKEVSVALVDNKYIKELNHEYRNKDEPTDVLSFPLDDEFLGDIIISLERAKEQAKEYGHSLAREIGFLTVHGMLHLLGYDHKEQDDKAKMRNQEEKVLKQLNLKRD
ncbi:rRNA maturation RNase YbeY [Selenihalanaerobacter shriftii]|uniref:Endoribonuclease YbeY n=1 Tax=Selenihalanaerobacter shriftii TaxID=142842 RepID=A0A1T4PZA0_9FIRM|nr:rRNA maturation RNase YbeY [Selenihalanaerobacter shriftii]SJZ96278.1 probable rRNA maturation factor [Selenihalanaerobacter shriftii]